MRCESLERGMLTRTSAVPRTSDSAATKFDYNERTGGEGTTAAAPARTEDCGAGARPNRDVSDFRGGSFTCRFAQVNGPAAVPPAQLFAAARPAVRLEPSISTGGVTWP